MKTILRNTPIEQHVVKGKEILVKREDLCGVPGSPTFSKIRGIVEHLKSLKQSGINIVGYTETSISMAGWGIAWACKMLDMKAVIFNPIYKEPHEVLEYHKEQWIKHNAEIIDIKAGMAKVNFYISKKLLYDKYGKKALLLPLGLPFKETISATANELKKTLKMIPKMDNIVVNIGSGTICAGIWKGLSEIDYICSLYGVMGRTGNINQKKELIAKKAKILNGGLFGKYIDLNLIDEGWEYTQKSEVKCPFPCHEYYDLKAWQWLTENINTLTGSVLFWNIGH